MEFFIKTVCGIPRKEKYKIAAYIVSYSRSYFRNRSTCTYSLLKPSYSVIKRNHDYVVHHNFSRVPKSWFRSKKKIYDIIDLHEVSPKHSVPDYILKPDYAHSGVANEHDSIQVMSENEVQCMKQSCALAKLMLEKVAKHIKAEISTDELDLIAHDLCIQHGAYPSPLNYRGFPKSICTSVNNIACHGIPDCRKLVNGDIISIDISVYYNGFHGDCAATFSVGEIDEKGQKLIEISSACLSAAISICHPNQSFCQIGKTISAFARHHGFSVIPAFCGHGIGSSFHTPPNILHYDNNEAGEMKKGMIFTIEPVICEGRPDIVILEDGWTAASEDDSRSAQFEHTVLITESGAEILTVSSAFKKD